MAERLANLGYLGLVKETVKGTPLTPTDFIPLYEETLDTAGNFVKQSPIYGNKAATYNVIQGQRTHKGDLTFLAEPNTTARIADMLLTRTSTTGSGPYSHTFVLSNVTNPNSYTIDISTGATVARYWGVEASKLSPSWNKNELQWKVSVSALGSFQSRSIASVSTNTITLDTAYDPRPNYGLVASDLVRIYKSSTGAVLDTTVTTVNADGITVVLGASAAAFAAGDTIQLRANPAVAYNLLPTFQWAKNQWQFGATAAAALSATQTRIEQGSSWDLMHSFESDDGALRSGGYDAAALIRTTGDLNITVKKYFDTNEDIIAFNNLTKNAIQIRHLSGPTNQYEMRLTANHVKYDGQILPNLKPGEIEYENLVMDAMYDSTDGQMYSLTVINSLATI